MNCETCRYSGYGWHENECSRPTTECSYQPIEQPKPETKEVKKELNNSNACISRRAALELGDNLRDDLPDDEQIAAAVMAHNEGIIEYQTKLSQLPSVQPTHTNNSNTLKSLDCVDRQKAIDAMTTTLWHYPTECLRNINKYEFAKGLAELGLKSLPSVQPDVPDTNVGDMISRQPEPYEDAVSRHRLLNDLKELIAAWEKYPVMAEQIKGVEVAIGYVKTIPSVTPKPEPLTDNERRIFLSAMRREENVCEEVDRKYPGDPYEDSLMRVCKEIKRKVKGALWT